MGKLSEQMNKYIGGVPSLGEPGILITKDGILGKGVFCPITGNEEPKKGGFFHDRGKGYMFSSYGVLDNSCSEGRINMGIAVGDAILDGEPIEIELAIKRFLGDIEYGMRYAIIKGSKSK